MKTFGTWIIWPLALALSAGCGTSKGGADAAAKKPAELSAAIRAAYLTSECAEGVWRIDEHGEVNMFLVLGKEKALLIDSGLGEPGLDAVVASLTGLPVIVMNTHGHEDHAGGNTFFDTIYAHPDDMDMVKRNSPGKRDIREARGGFVFDLGGRRLEVVETPGHTKGSVCLLDAENRILFTGDNNNGHVWLFLYESLPVEAYLRSLESLIARSSEFDVMYPGHGDRLPPEFLEGAAECARDILKGGIETEPYRNFYGAKAYSRMDILIAFDPNKILLK